MPRLKYFNYDTLQWENVVVGAQGEQGIQGEQSVVSATDPIIYNAETQNVSFGSPDYITLDTTPETSSLVPGTVYWDSGEGTPTVILNSSVNLNLGQENVALCYNGTGSTITNGSVVYISGAQGQRPSITLADADSEATSSKTFGMATEDILDGAEGFVTTFGIVNGVNTASFTDGQALWLSQTAGQVTATRPLAPAHTVFVGYCLKSNASSGRIFINPQNGYELDELHDMLITSPEAGNLVVRNTENTLWENMTPAEAGLSEIGHTHDDRYYTESETDTAISNAVAGLVDSAPATLDTLNELAAALNDDANFASTVTTALGTKSDTGHTHDDRYYTETEANSLLSAKANVSGQAFSGTITSPNIGANIASPAYRVETNGRVKLRSDGAQSAGMWMTDNSGTESIFWGNLSTTGGVNDGTGIYHSGGWKFYTTANLTTMVNDTEIQRWRGHLDRSWDNYPSITIFNTTDKGPQGEFRLHGYPGSNGADYSIVMRSDGGYVTGSDARRKVNVEEISNALNVISQISGKKFNIINSEGDIETDLSSETTGKKFGFIAQEVADVIPEAVKYYPEADNPNEIGYASAYSIDYSSVVPLLLQGIKELTEKVNDLESRLNGGA